MFIVNIILSITELFPPNALDKIDINIRKVKAGSKIVLSCFIKKSFTPPL